MMDERQLLALLRNQEIVKGVNEVPLDYTMATVLEGIVDKQAANQSKRETLRETLAKLKDFKPQVSAAELEKLVGEFQQEAVKAYQRIASSTVSIIEGELSGLTSGVPGAFSFGDNPNKELLDSKAPFQKTKMRQYQYQIDDVKRALEFMEKECDYVKEALEKESNELVDLIDSEATLQFTSDVVNLITITREYIEVISDTDDLKKSIDNFTSALNSVEKINSDSQYHSREWGTDLLKGMINFTTFACRVAESESDLNKLNKVDGAGVVRRGLTRAFSDIIVLDQKFYPDNNQIPIPPTSVSPVVISKYLLAYKERAIELVNASYEQVNSINNKFDRQITTAKRDMSILSETMLMPKPAALSAAGTVITATPTPEAFLSQQLYAEGRPGSPEDVSEMLKKGRADYLDRATQYAVGLGALAKKGAKKAKKGVKEAASRAPGLQPRIPPPILPPPLPPPQPRSASEKALDTLGDSVSWANPRRRRKARK
tara:strand:+ start:8852 stop:10312 length:1461 start_codon:yes stop_codon:yes gene_type:complete